MLIWIFSPVNFFLRHPLLYFVILFLTFSEGPRYENYALELVTDNKTKTDVDLGQLGGPRKAVAEFKGDSLYTYLHKLNDNIVDVIAICKINPDTPNRMTYIIRDVASGKELKQIMFKQ